MSYHSQVNKSEIMNMMNLVVKGTAAFFFVLAIVVVAQPVLGSRRNTLQQHTSAASSSNDDLVTNLPGQPAVDFKHYAGYVTVDQTHGRNLFYWFFEAATAPDQKPLVLWLNGGPGCSSVGYGAAQEIGPFLLDIGKQGLVFNDYSWNKEANVLFVESPIGVGFSYTNTPSDFVNQGDNSTAQDSYTFLHQWFAKFPSYRNRTLYIAGESYAGKYIPELAEVIFDKNSDPSLHIDLKGILMGNPETDDNQDWRGLVDYAWSHAVTSDENHAIINKYCNFFSNDTWSNKNCSNAVDEVLNQYQEIDMYSLYSPTCTKNDTKSPKTASSKARVWKIKRTSTVVPRIMGGYDPCLDDFSTKFFNRAGVQKALHVNDGVTLKNWSICNNTMFDAWADSNPSLIPTYKKLIAAGLRIWVYSGDTDGRVPVLATRYSLSGLGLPITKTWRAWYNQKQVSGWYQEYQGLTYATVKGAGHDVPSFKPAESLVLFTSFLHGESLPSSR